MEIFNLENLGSGGLAVGVFYFIIRDLIRALAAKRYNGYDKISEARQRDINFQEKICTHLEKQTIVLDRMASRLTEIHRATMNCPYNAPEEIN